MRVLFYLPVVTSWWFENIIVPLLEKLVADNEVHILAPIFWKGTGVGQDQYDLCAHLPQICWHVVTDQDHTTMLQLTFADIAPNQLHDEIAAVSIIV